MIKEEMIMIYGAKRDLTYSRFVAEEEITTY